jgi:hypothetical protein
MKSKIAEAVGLHSHPMALLWAETAPAGATQFKPGRWACVMSMFAAAAAKARTCAFDRDAYGCWGGGVGLGFGNCYATFPGGMEGFYRFLADGNECCEQGREIGKQLAVWNDSLADDFLKGERYLKDAATTKRFVEAIPMREIPARYVVVKPIEHADPQQETIKSVTFFADPDQLSALVILANYTEPDLENVIIPWAAGCQVIGIFGYRELERWHPRALIGLTDISARLTVRPLLGNNVLSFTAPWPLFLKMEKNVENSFFERETWRQLRQHN